MVNNNKSNQRRTYVNEAIKAFNVLLLDENGGQIGTFARKDALNKAKDAGLDLVQVGYNAQEKVSICKIIDYGKYQYDFKKKDKEKRQSQKSKGIKEIKISYSIEEKDLEMKIEKSKDLLKKGYNVKVTLRLRGRENVFKEQAEGYMYYMEEKLNDYSKSGGVKKEGKGFSLILFAKLK